MILVVSPNPALDRIAVVHFRARSTLRPERFFLWPGGSAVHAGHVATVLGADVSVVGFAGGATGALLAEQAESHGLRATWLEVVGETRQTFSLLDLADGNICDVVEPGPRVEADAVAAFEEAVVARLADASVMVISGSLPDGCRSDLPARLIHAARGAGVAVIADLQGPVLETAVEAGPWMIKPSLEEVTRHLGRAPQARELLDLCRRWHDRGVRHVCVSLAEHGLLWVSDRGPHHLAAPVVAAYNSIGCGDTLVGATAATYERVGDVATALRAGVAAATANLRHDAPGHCERDEVDALAPMVTDEVIDEQGIERLLATRSRQLP